MTHNYHYEATKIQEAIAYAHGPDGICTNDIDEDWCEQCIHLKPEVIAFVKSVPRWMLIASVLTIRTVNIYEAFINYIKLLVTYPFKRGRKGNSNA